jgi:hypothetical protein
MMLGSFWRSLIPGAPLMEADMLPMTTAVQKPEEPFLDMLDRIRDTGLMRREDAQRILATCVETKWAEHFARHDPVRLQQAIAVKLAGV